MLLLPVLSWRVSQAGNPHHRNNITSSLEILGNEVERIGKTQYRKTEFLAVGEAFKATQGLHSEPFCALKR